MKQPINSPCVRRPNAERRARRLVMPVMLLPPGRGHDPYARPSPPGPDLRRSSGGTNAINPVVKHRRRPRHGRSSCAAGEAVVEVAPPGHDQAVLSPRSETGAVGAKGTRGHGA